MKMIKKLLIGIFVTLLTLALILSALVCTHPYWLGSLAKSAANKALPVKLGAGFSIGDLQINAFRGSAAVKDLYVANPSNFVERDAVKLGSLKVSVVPESLQNEVVHIELIEADDIFINYVKQNGTTNFDAIGKSFSSDDGAGGEVSKDKSGKRGDSRRYIIDKIRISKLKMKYGMFTFPVPFPITLTDIGKESGGVDLMGAVMEVLNQLLTTAMEAGSAAKDSISQLLTSSLQVTTGTVENVKDLEKSFKSVGDSFKSTFKSLKKELKKSVK
jgi:hypothetical protein